MSKRQQPHQDENVSQKSPMNGEEKLVPQGRNNDVLRPAAACPVVFGVSSSFIEDQWVALDWNFYPGGSFIKVRTILKSEIQREK